MVPSRFGALRYFRGGQNRIESAVFDLNTHGPFLWFLVMRSRLKAQANDSGQQAPDGSCLLTATRLCRLRGSPHNYPFKASTDSLFSSAGHSSFDFTLRSGSPGTSGHAWACGTACSYAVLGLALGGA